MTNKLYKTVLAALFAAFICVATLLIQIPLPFSGYGNLGDCFILLAAWILGGKYGFAAAGVGSALADIIVGFPVYAPATFIVKGAMAVVATMIFTKLGEKHKFIARVIGAAAAECVMVGGYFLYECILYGVSSAALNVIGNGCQGICGLVTGVVMINVLSKAGSLIFRLRKNS